ncbi:hypothetical protein J1N35_000038 [Gossypium stocksii]|uniref:Secreted protein n=1 Tax=Gossypium stocksii TaxID=47602 RepID=A0A9D3WGX5_9ROSI|nr:hypothetical protein J1N35_000038 [Gossypium stocksii]
MALTNFILTVAGVSAVVLLLRSDVKQSAAIFRRNVKHIRNWLEEESSAASKPLNGGVLCPGCLCLVLSLGFVSQLYGEPQRVHGVRAPCLPRKCNWNHSYPLMPYKGMGSNLPRSNACISLVGEVLPLCKPIRALCGVVRQNLGDKTVHRYPRHTSTIERSVRSTLKTSPKSESVLPSTVIKLPDWLRGLWNS